MATKKKSPPASTGELSTYHGQRKLAYRKVPMSILLRNRPIAQAMADPSIELSCPLPDYSTSIRRCPVCRGHVVANTYHVGGLGFVTKLQCYGAIAEGGECPIEDYALTFGDGSEDRGTE